MKKKNRGGGISWRNEQKNIYRTLSALSEMDRIPNCSILFAENVRIINYVQCSEKISLHKLFIVPATVSGGRWVNRGWLMFNAVSCYVSDHLMGYGSVWFYGKFTAAFSSNIVVFFLVRANIGITELIIHSQILASMAPPEE